MKRYILLGLTIVFLFALMPMSQISSVSTVPQTYPGIFIADKTSLAHDPYDPATNYESFGQSIIKEIYEGLYSYNGNDASSYRPVLAVDYTVSPDGLNYTFGIRQGVAFSDGSPFNAFVMQYSIQRAIIMNDPSSGIWILDQSIRNASWIGGMNNENIYQANAFLRNMSVHANNEYSLSIYLSTPSAAFLSKIILPTAYAVSPSWIITHEPMIYTSYSMVPLSIMFPTLTTTEIRNYLGLTNTTAYPSLDNSGIVPQSAHDDPNLGFSYFGIHAMGTGPYVLSSETAGVSITLARNNNWWNKVNFHKDSTGAINAPQQIIYKQVPDLATQISDLTTGKAHIIDLPQANFTSVFDPSSLLPGFNNLNVFKYPSLGETVLGFNENHTISTPGQILTNSSSTYNAATIKANNLLQYTWETPMGFSYASPENPFTALAFRKAFAYAFNYTQYITRVTNNQNFRLGGIIPQGLFGHQNDLISAGYIPSQNLILARQLFQKIGWEGNITINYNTGNIALEQTAIILANVINNLGVGINIIPTEVTLSQFLTLDNNGGSALFFWSKAPDYADANDYTVPFLHTGGEFASRMHYSNPHVDVLMDTANTLTSNTATKNALYRQMEINASQDYPYIYLDQQNNFTVLSRWVTDWNASVAGNENSLNFGTNFQYVGLNSYIPRTNLADLSTITTYPLLSLTTGTLLFSKSTNSSSNTTSMISTIKHSSTPGFEIVSVLSLLLVVSLVFRKRKLK